MLEYPIYKHLIQFSSLIDKNGNLLSDPYNGVPGQYGGSSQPKSNMNGEEAKAGDNDSSKKKNEDDKDTPLWEGEGGEKDDFAYEGGDTQNTQSAKNN